MPIYEYEAIDLAKGCAECSSRFEQFQKFDEPALTQCPQCGAAVQRVLSCPSIHGVGSEKNMLTNKSLSEKGFTKYVKKGDGYYEKTAGKGPDVIKR